MLDVKYWGGIKCTLNTDTTSSDYGTLVLTRGESSIAANGTATPWYNRSKYTSIIKHIEIKNKIQFNNNASLDYLFFDCSQCESIVGLNNLNVDNVVSMNAMFTNCSSLTTLDVSSWNTANVTQMYNMFGGCKQLTSINGLNNWDVSKVTNINWMFNNCNELKELDLSNWNTPNVQFIGWLFNGCKKLTYLNLNGLTLINESNNINVEINILNGLNKLETIITPYQFDSSGLFQQEFKSRFKTNLKECDTGKLVDDSTTIKPSFIYTKDETLISNTRKLCNSIVNVLK